MQPEKRARKGEGSLFQRSDGYWVYQVKNKGQRVVEFLGTQDEKEARRALAAVKRRVFGEIAREEHRPATTANVTVDRLLDDYLAYLTLKKRKSVNVVRLVINAHVRPYFKHLKAAAVTTADIQRYRKQREHAVCSATVNRDITHLHAAFALGMKQTPRLVEAIPYMPKAAETNVRTGLLPFAGYKMILEVLPASIKPLFVCAFHVSTRKGEWLPLTWDKVDDDFIRLDTGTTKNDEGRLLPIYGDMRDWLKRQRELRDQEFPEVEHVFFWHEEDTRLGRGGVRLKPGSPIRDFRQSWAAAVKEAGYPDLLFHDLRRTAQRNMSRAGIPREQRMKISGHKTDAMERRYNIVDLEDLKESRGKMDQWFRDQSAAPAEK